MFRSIAVVFVFVGFCSTMEIFEKKDKVMTARCRAHCLNKFQIDSPSKNCMSMLYCGACWNLCDKLYTTEVWKPICDLKKKTHLPGCQEACDFYRSHSELIEGTRTDTHFTQALKYHFDSSENLVNIAWSHPEGNDKIEPLVYVVKAKDLMTNKWQQIDQTFYLNSTFSKFSVLDASEIRIIAYDSNGKIAELRNSMEEFNLDSWRPVMTSMNFPLEKFGAEVDVAISWPNYSDRVNRYEIEWKHADNAVDITGHLSTDTNSTVISLWPYSFYQVTVRAFSEDSQLGVVIESESLYINTTPMLSEEKKNLAFQWKVAYTDRALTMGFLSILILMASILIIIGVNLYRNVLDIKMSQNRSCEPCLRHLSTSTVKIRMEDDGSVRTIPYRKFSKSLKN